MANQKISTMPAAGPLDGTELMEVVQGGVNKKVPTNAVIQTEQYDTIAPGAGTITDFALPGTSDYLIDIDTTLGDVEIDGTIAQRDGQCVTYANTGANNLRLGVNLGTLVNRIRANAGPLLIAPNDNLTIKYSDSISRWLVV